MPRVGHIRAALEADLGPMNHVFQAVVYFFQGGCRAGEPGDVVGGRVVSEFRDIPTGVVGKRSFQRFNAVLGDNGERQERRKAEGEQDFKNFLRMKLENIRCAIRPGFGIYIGR